MKVGIYKQTARDIMTRHVDVVHSRETVHDALALMAENRLSAVPVVNAKGKCVGMLSQSDLVAMLHGVDTVDLVGELPYRLEVTFDGTPIEDVASERVEDVMSEGIVTVSPDDLVVDVADKMLEYGVHHIPVCGDEEELLGFISTMDILGGLRASKYD